MNSKESLKKIVSALSNRKGEDIKVIDISKLTYFAEYFVIVHGNNAPQLEALMDSVEESLKEDKKYPKSIEGDKNGMWILMDFGDIIVHIFNQEGREFYDLDRVWSDGVNISLEDLLEEK